MRKVYLFICILFFVSNVFAQQDSLKTKELGEVVVTAQFKPQSAKNSVYQVRTISKEKILKQGATKLQDVLNNELNIRFSQDVATGGSDITMMGLKGQNVKILIDGLPMIGRQGTSNEININQVDLNAIERIEIVEGPMSVVYGSDALAGVINIITKKTVPVKFSVTARLHEESVGDEYGLKPGIHNQYAGFTWRKKNWEIGGGFGHNYFGGWKDTAVERELVWHKKDQLLGSGFIAYTKNKFSLRYRFDGLDEIITNPGNFIFYQQSSGDTLAKDQEYLTQRMMHQLQGSYRINQEVNFQLQSSYSDYSRQVFSTTVSSKTGDVRLDDAAGSQSMVDFTGFTLRGIAYYRLNKTFSFQPGVEINIDKGEGERLKEGNNSIGDYAFFISSEITPNAKINIRPGIRIIKNSIYQAPPIIPSINTKFTLGKQVDLRLAYARAFRAPSLRELYFNFFDANHQIIGNTDLKAETSHSFTGSLNFKKVTPKQVVYSTVLSGFYNHVKNLIDYAVSASDPNVFIMGNVSHSKTAGANVNTIAKYKSWNIAVGAGYTGFYNDYEDKDAALPQMLWSAEITTSAGYSFSKIGLDVNLFYKFTGKRPFYMEHNQKYILAQAKGYQLADLTVNKKIGKYILLNTGIRNLFDIDRVKSTVSINGIHTNGGISSIANGRSFFAGINFNWNK